MSLFTYNSVSLPLPTGIQFSRQALYDQSQTDWFCTRFSIRINCVLNLSYLVVKDTGRQLETPAEIVNALWTLLMTPRKQLSYKVANVEMIPAAQGVNTGTVDAMNGPQPQFCNLLQLTPTSFVLDYHIIAHYWTNNQSDGTNLNRAGNNILFNRWTESVTIDEMMITTRTRQGALRIRSDNINALTPDLLRSQFAVLSVPYNFVRQSSQYAVSPDGLTLAYTIVDREVFKQPPPPAFKAEGYFVELGSKPGAIYREGIVNVRLYGAPNIDQADLYKAAFTVAAKKMSANVGKPDKQVYDNANADGIFGDVKLKPLTKPLYSMISRKVWLYENIVEIELRALLNFAKERIAGVPIGRGPMTITPGSDDIQKEPPVYRDRGSANLLLRAAAYWDPNAIAGRTQLVAGPETAPTNPATGVSTAPTRLFGGLTLPASLAPQIDLPGKQPGTTGK